MDIKEMEAVTQSTQKQVLAYFSQMASPSQLLIGNTVLAMWERQVLECLISSLTQKCDNKLFGLTLIWLGDETYLVGDGAQVYISLTRAGELTIDAQ